MRREFAEEGPITGDVFLVPLTEPATMLAFLSNKKHIFNHNKKLLFYVPKIPIADLVTPRAKPSLFFYNIEKYS